MNTSALYGTVLWYGAMAMVRHIHTHSHTLTHTHRHTHIVSVPVDRPCDCHSTRCTAHVRDCLLHHRAQIVERVHELQDLVTSQARHVELLDRGPAALEESEAGSCVCGANVDSDDEGVEERLRLLVEECGEDAVELGDAGSVVLRAVSTFVRLWG